jgi:hypothetical protein
MKISASKSSAHVVFAVVVICGMVSTAAQAQSIKLPLGAYSIETFPTDNVDDFCVTEETNRQLTPEAWKAHFAKMKATCEVSPATTLGGFEVSWTGKCASVALGQTYNTSNVVRVGVNPVPHGFSISTTSTGDVTGTASLTAKPIGACKPDMPVLRPWG